MDLVWVDMALGPWPLELSLHNIYLLGMGYYVTLIPHCSPSTRFDTGTSMRFESDTTLGSWTYFSFFFPFSSFFTMRRLEKREQKKTKRKYKRRLEKNRESTLSLQLFLLFFVYWVRLLCWCVHRSD